MTTINTNTYIKALLDQYPQSSHVLFRYGMACVGCDISRFHTIEEVAHVYQIDPLTLLAEIRQSITPSEID